MSEEPISLIDGIRKAWIDAGLIPAEFASEPPKVLTEEEQISRVKAQIAAQRMESFKTQCPEQFRSAINRGLIPNLAAWDEADLWSGSHPGPWIWSHETGRGKTRMLWRKFGHLHVRCGKSVVKITGQALAEEYFSFHMAGHPRAFYEWILKYDVVMIDDLDKMDLEDKRAPRMCRELFDEFYAHKTPVLVTANEPIAHFQKRIGESTSRRMADVTREIQF